MSKQKSNEERWVYIYRLLHLKNAFYYTLKTDACDHSVWNDVTVSKAIRAVPSTLKDQPVFLFIDDTMVEKSGRYFELCSKLYDHAAHNGSNYLNGHCMVSLLLSFPVYQNGKIRCLSVPVGYRHWDKEKKQTRFGRWTGGTDYENYWPGTSGDPAVWQLVSKKWNYSYCFAIKIYIPMLDIQFSPNFNICTDLYSVLKLIMSKHKICYYP